MVALYRSNIHAPHLDAFAARGCRAYPTSFCPALLSTVICRCLLKASVRKLRCHAHSQTLAAGGLPVLLQPPEWPLPLPQNSLMFPWLTIGHFPVSDKNPIRRIRSDQHVLVRLVKCRVISAADKHICWVELSILAFMCTHTGACCYALLKAGSQQL